MNDDQALELQQRLRRFWLRQRAEQPPAPGLTRRTSQVFGAVYRAGGETSPGEIAEALGQASSNVAAALRELESAGYVVRRRDEDDGRRVRVVITPAGHDALAETRLSRAGWLQEVADATLTPAEQEQLLAASELLDRMATWRGHEPA